MPIVNFIAVDTTLAAPSVPPLNYIPIAGIPSSTAPFVEDAKTYSSTTEMIDDGFTLSDPAVLSATQVFGQGDFAGASNIPTRLVVIKRGTAQAQVTEAQVLTTVDATYKLWTSVLGGTPVLVSTFVASGNTDVQIRDGLIAAWTGVDQSVLPNATTIIDVTAVLAGAPFVLSATLDTGGGDIPATAAQILISEATPSIGLYDDLAAGFTAAKFWAAVLDPATADGDVLEASRWCEGTADTLKERRNICIPQQVNVTLAAVLVALDRDRTFPVIHPTGTDHMNASDFGRYGALFPGSRDWHFCPLGGTTATTSIIYTKAQGDAFKAARVSWVERDGPASTDAVRVFWGQGSGGFFIVQKQAEDYWWLRVNAVLIARKSTNEGINLDDAGIAKMVSEINIVNIEVAAEGVIDLAQTVVTPVPLADVPASEQAVGDYQTTGGILVETVLIPKLRSLRVSAVFATA